MPFRLTKQKVIDGLLLFGAIFSFSFYAMQALVLEKSATGHPLAELTLGETNRKILGNVVFSKIGEGSSIYNRDVLWVQESPWIKIRFEGGSELSVRKGSIVVISRSLRPGDRGGKIELLQGEMHFEKSTSFPWSHENYEFYSAGKKVDLIDGQKKLDVQAEIPVPVPSPSFSPPVAERSLEKHPAVEDQLKREGIYPKMNSILLKSTGKVAEIHFAWANRLTGELEIQGEGGSPKTIQLQDQASAQVSLPVEITYWDLLALVFFRLPLIR
jgi:hypothetical protein